MIKLPVDQTNHFFCWLGSIALHCFPHSVSLFLSLPPLSLVVEHKCSRVSSV
jgi:hypothetical protein